MNRVHKFVYGLVVGLLFAASVAAQDTTTITGTVIDPSSTAWAQSYWKAKLIVPAGGRPVYIDGTTPAASYSGYLDSTGAFQSGAVVWNTSKLLPAGTTVEFTVCSYTSAPCQHPLPPIAVTGSTFNAGNYINSKIQSLQIEAANIVYAYNSAEIVNAINGTGYINTVSGNCYAYNSGSYTQTCGGNTYAFNSSTAPIYALDGTNYSTWLTLSPYTFGAKCDGTGSLESGVTGTNDRLAMYAMILKSLSFNSSTIPTEYEGVARPIISLPFGKMCIANPPGGFINTVAVASNVVTVTGTNFSLTAGTTVAGQEIPADVVTPQGLTGSCAFLNGVPLTVASATSTSFTAPFHFYNVGTTTCNNLSGQSFAGYAPAPAFQIFSKGLQVVGGEIAVNSGTGPIFQFDVDEVAQINGTCTYSNPNLTCPVTTMPNGHVFPSNSQLGVTDTNTALDYHSYTTVSTSSTSITINIGSTSIVPTYGLITLPWVQAPNYGTANQYNFTNVVATNYSEQNFQPCNGFASATVCRNTYWMDFIRDYQNGFGFINNVQASNMDHSFWCVACQFTNMHAFVSNGGNGMYFGPASGPLTIDSYQSGYPFPSLDVWLDGAYDVKFTGQSHFRSGNTTNPPVLICNTSQGGTTFLGVFAINGANNIYFQEPFFEYGEATNPSLNAPPPEFVGIDTCSASVVNSNNIIIANPSIANAPLGNSNNVPFIAIVGADVYQPGAPTTNNGPYVRITDPVMNNSPAFGSSFTSYVKSLYGSGATSQPSVYFDDSNPLDQSTGSNTGSAAICLSASSGTCKAYSLSLSSSIVNAFRTTTSSTNTLYPTDGVVNLANNFTMPSPSGFTPGRIYQLVNNTGNDSTISGAIQNNMPSVLQRGQSLSLTNAGGSWFVTNFATFIPIQVIGGASRNQTGYATASVITTVPGPYGISGLGYNISANVTCRTATTGASVALSMSYTDTSNTVQTVTGTTANCTALGSSSVGSINEIAISAKAGTNITLTTVNTGSPTYDYSGWATPRTNN